MTKINLQRVLDLDKQATPGPWLAHDNGTGWILQTSPAKHLNSMPEAQFKERDAQLTSYYRNNAPAMAKALQAVLELHHPVKPGPQSLPWCPACSDKKAGMVMIAPCPTVQAIHDHLGEQA